jgi:hypothetical protein
MERGQVGGLNFKMAFPGYNGYTGNQQPLTTGLQPSESGYADLPDNLDGPRSKVEALYKNYGLLKSIMIDLERKGIRYDVPDYSQDDGGTGHQAFLAADAIVRYSAQALKKEAELRKEIAKQKMMGNIMQDPNFNPDEELYGDHPDSVFSTKLTPGVEQLNRNLSQETNTQSDQNRANSQIPFTEQDVDAQVQSGYMSPAQGEYLKSQIVDNKYRQQMFRPYSPYGRGGSGNQDEFVNRAQLIRQIKSGITTNDQTPINMLRLVPGVEDVSYVNTGDKVGLEVALKGQPASFIDLSKGGGEGEINALLNRIEGQKNIPNEKVFQYDTQVQIPKSNVKTVIDKLKTSDISSDSFQKETLPKLKELAQSGDLMLPTGEVIADITFSGPYFGFLGKNEIVIKHFKTKANGQPDYSKTVTKDISDPEELANLVEVNANKIAPAFGGGFEGQKKSETDPDI